MKKKLTKEDWIEKEEERKKKRILCEGQQMLNKEKEKGEK